MTSHDRKWKEAKLAEITELAKEYPFVAVATLNELPASILSVLRKRLKGDAVIVVSKLRVVRRAFEAAGQKDDKLNGLIQDSVAVIFSKKNPFELFSFIKKNKGDAVAKPGDTAIADIEVQAGDTGLPPGPALSILKGAGLKVAVQGPTISIVKDKIVTKKGEEVSPDVADVLGKLNMKPMKVGMKVLGILDKAEKQFYSADALDVDEEELFNKFVTAYQQALNLAVEAEIFNDASTEVLVIKAERAAKAVNDSLDLDAPASEKKEEAPAEAEKKEEEATEEKTEEAKEEPKAEPVAEEVKVEEAKEVVEETDTEKEAQEVAEQVVEATEEKKEEASASEKKEETVEAKVEETNTAEVDKEAAELAEQATDEEKKKTEGEN
jgi:large subunit ribosomal protein L10